MWNVAYTLHHGPGKFWQGFLYMRALPSRVSCASTVLSKHEVGVKLLFCPIFWDHGRACTRGGGACKANNCSLSAIYHPGTLLPNGCRAVLSDNSLHNGANFRFANMCHPRYVGCAYMGHNTCIQVSVRLPN